MKYSGFIKASIFKGMVMFLYLVALGCQSNIKQRPNIIYLFTDQQTAYAMSCMGNPYLETPGMDKIASMGVRFENCYVAQPLCCPNRTSMFTGLYPHQTGAVVNVKEESNLVGDSPMLAKILKDSGYSTALFGKWHIASSSANKKQHGFDEIWNKSEYTHKDFDELVANKILEFCKRDHKTPFFVVGSFINPHNVCELARGNKEKAKEFPNYTLLGYPDIKDCPPLPISFSVPDNEPQKLRAVYDDPDNNAQYPTEDWTEEDWRQYLWIYYRMVEHVDQAILRIVNGLEEAGLLENTVIIFSSDHGEGMAEHHWNQKQVLYESSVNVPFIVSWKGKTKAGIIHPGLINNGIDIFPTICDYAGVELPGHYQGKSIRPLVTGEKENVHEYLVVETVFARGVRQYGLKGRCIRTKRYKYIVYNEGEFIEQLFDMELDPMEMNNLALEKDFQKVLREHRRLILEWGKQTKDDFSFIR